MTIQVNKEDFEKSTIPTFAIPEHLFPNEISIKKMCDLGGFQIVGDGGDYVEVEIENSRTVSIALSKMMLFDDPESVKNLHDSYDLLESDENVIQNLYKDNNVDPKGLCSKTEFWRSFDGGKFLVDSLSCRGSKMSDDTKVWVCEEKYLDALYPNDLR